MPLLARQKISLKLECNLPLICKNCLTLVSNEKAAKHLLYPSCSASVWLEHGVNDVMKLSSTDAALTDGLSFAGCAEWGLPIKRILGANTLVFIDPLPKPWMVEARFTSRLLCNSGMSTAGDRLSCSKTKWTLAQWPQPITTYLIWTVDVGDHSTWNRPGRDEVLIITNPQCNWLLHEMGAIKVTFFPPCCLSLLLPHMSEAQLKIGFNRTKISDRSFLTSFGFDYFLRGSGWRNFILAMW